MLNSIHWKINRHSSSIPYGNHYKSWLLDKGSLTARLVKASQGEFSVKILKQYWQPPLLDEAILLGVKHRQQALIREVLLLCHGTPWVYAKTVMPIRSITGKTGYLKSLKNKSLGAALFKDPSLKRSGFEIAQIPPSKQHPFLRELSKNTVIYGRRSLFTLHTKKILVAEVFLPACLAHTSHSNNQNNV